MTCTKYTVAAFGLWSFCNGQVWSPCWLLWGLTLVIIFSSFIGVKQGCSLSLKLFNIFVNDIPNLLNDRVVRFGLVRLGNTNLNCLLYADDLVLLLESQKGLHHCLLKLEMYTKILLNGTSAQRSTYITTNWVFGSNILEQVNKYRYLGIMINSSGTFKQTLKRTTNPHSASANMLRVMNLVFT